MRFSRFGTLRHLHATKALFVPRGALSSEARARAFVAAYPGLLGMQATDKLVFRATRPRAAGAGLYVRFRQRHAGVDVEAGALSVLLDAQGHVDGLLSQLVPDIAKSAQPSLSAKAAKALLPVGDSPIGQAKLVFAATKDGGVELSWRWRVRDPTGAPKQVWLSAESGTMLRRASMHRHALGVDELKVAEGSSMRRVNPDYYCYCCTPDPNDPIDCQQCGCMASGTNGMQLQQIWDSTEHISQYLETHFSRDGWKGSGHSFYSKLAVGYDNAHFDPNDDTATFGLNYATADVVGHEYGHGLHLSEGTATEDFAESRSIAEGLADVFSQVISRSDWCLGGYTNPCIRNVKAPYYGPCGGGGQATSFRAWCFDEDDTIDNEAQYYFNASLVAHSYYLASVSNDPPPPSCEDDQECRDAAGDPSNGKISCGCADGPATCARYPGDTPRVCLVTEHGVRVPYLGRDLAFLPYYYAITSGALGADPLYHHVYDDVVQAAIDWDVNNGYPDADYLAKSTRRALLANGHWTMATTGSDPNNNVQAWHRPGVLTNAHPSHQTCSASSPCDGGLTCEAGFCTPENWTHMFVAQPEDGNDPGRIMVRKSLNGETWSADNILYFDGSPQEAGSGISVARDPRLQDRLTAAMVFKRRNDERIQFATAALDESSSPSWSPGHAFGTADSTPAIAFFDGTFIVAWKEAGGEQLKYGFANESFESISDIPGAESTNAPTMTVAKGRLWVFFTGTGNSDWEGAYPIRYTSYDGSSWEPVRDLGQIEPERLPVSSFAPEAKTYGIEGNERVWLFFLRYHYVRMFSFVPPLLSGSADLSQLPVMDRDAPIPLRSTQTPSNFDHDPWMSVFETDGYLRTYFKHRETLDAWTTSKRGDG